jgi:hypothetical protein
MAQHLHAFCMSLATHYHLIDVVPSSLSNCHPLNTAIVFIDIVTISGGGGIIAVAAAVAIAAAITIAIAIAIAVAVTVAVSAVAVIAVIINVHPCCPIVVILFPLSFCRP